MRIRTVLLLGALALASCGPIEQSSPPQPTTPPATSAPTTVPPAVTAPPAASAPTAVSPAVTAPTAPMPTTTAVPAAPRVTATNAPTAPPSAATAEPAPTELPVSEPIRMLSPKLPWVRIGSTLHAQGGGTLDLEQLRFPTIAYEAKAAPNGAYLAYLNNDGQLTVLDMGGSTLPLPEQAAGQPVGFVFSPDSSTLALTTIEGERWRLEAIDLQSGEAQMLQEGSTIPTSDSPAKTLRPLGWTAAGLLADHVLWASDAPSHNLALVDPADGSVVSLRAGAHLQVAPSAGGERVAVVTGQVPIGETPKFALSVVDVASGAETTIVPEQQGLVKALRWSPDGATLLYAASEDYGAPATSVVALNADGSNAQQVDFGVPGFEMAFQDIQWLDAQTPLVLVANGAQVELHALPLSAFDATGLQPIGASPAQADQVGQILYVPGGREHGLTE